MERQHQVAANHEMEFKARIGTVRLFKDVDVELEVGAVVFQPGPAIGPQQVVNRLAIQTDKGADATDFRFVTIGHVYPEQLLVVQSVDKLPCQGDMAVR